MPNLVDKYYDEVKKGNPSYSEAQIWATAWSIACKNGVVDSEHCHKEPGEYLKGKSATHLEMVARVAGRARRGSLPERVVRRYMLACAGGCSCGGSCSCQRSADPLPNLDVEMARLEGTSLSSLKVAEAFQRQALDFSTPDQLREYLHEHPGADKSKHRVVKNEGSPSKGDEGKGDKDHGKDEHGGGHGEHESKPLKDRLKGWGKKTLDFMQSAPKAAQKFVADDSYRRESLMKAHEKLLNAPKSILDNAVNTVKEEVHEYKTAAEGIKSVMSGGKLTKPQKHAIKTVAIHLALTAAATALTVSGGPLAGAAAFGKSMAKSIAMKAVHRGMGHIAMLEELGHIGHGVAHGLEHIMTKLAEEGGDVDPGEALAKLIFAATAKEIKDLDLDGIREALEASEGKDEDAEPKKKTAYTDPKTLADVARRMVRPLDEYVRLMEGLGNAFGLDRAGPNVWANTATEDYVGRLDRLADSVTSVAYEGLDALSAGGDDDLQGDSRYQALLLSIPDFARSDLKGVRSRDPEGHPAVRYDTHALRSRWRTLLKEAREAQNNFRSFQTSLALG